MGKQYLEVGKIVNIHGLTGEIKVVPWCDGPDFLCQFDRLYLGESRKPVEVEAARIQKQTVLLRLEGVTTAEQAQQLRGQILYLDRSDVQLEDGVYFIQDLIGLRVLDADTGAEYGTLTDVLQTGANDVYEVTDSQKKHILIPAIPDVITETNLEEGTLRIRPMEGLLDAN